MRTDKVRKSLIWAMSYMALFILVGCHQPSWQSGFDSVVDKILTDRCGAAVIRFPPGGGSTVPTDWLTYRHPALGIELRYPSIWEPFDYTSAFIRFRDPARSMADGELFNIVNAAWEEPMQVPGDFLRHIGPPVTMTKTLVIDHQPALFMQLRGNDAEGKYQSVVGLIHPDGRTLTVSNRAVDPVLFEQILSTIRYIVAVNPP